VEFERLIGRTRDRSRFLRKENLEGVNHTSRAAAKGSFDDARPIGGAPVGCALPVDKLVTAIACPCVESGAEAGKLNEARSEY
jgi:hypothetical protein